MSSQGESKVISIANTTDAYATGDLIGQPVAVDVSNAKSSGGQSVLIQGINVVDSSKSGKQMRLVILDALPTAVIADNAAYEPNIADIRAISDIITVSTWNQYNAGFIAILKQLALAVPGNTNRRFWVALVAAEAITFSAANSISIKASYYID